MAGRNEVDLIMKEMRWRLSTTVRLFLVSLHVMIFRVMMIWVLSWHVYLVPVSFLACPIRCEISDS